MTPRRHAGTFKHIEFLRLSEKSAILLIVVTTDGDVQNRILFTERDYSASELVEAANLRQPELFRPELRGRARAAAGRAARDRAGPDQADERRARCRQTARSPEGSEQYVISGERNLLSVQELSQDMSRLKQLFELFERKTSLFQILDVSLRGQGVQIFIGGESGVTAPDDVQRGDRALQGRRRRSSARWA